MATGSVHVEGLRELGRAFRQMDKRVARELSLQLAEAGRPVARRSTQYITSGGGGFGPMSGVRAPWSEMRVGASRTLGRAWVAPAWSSNKGTIQGAILSVHMRFRMEGALEDESEAVEKVVNEWLGKLEDDWAY